MRRAARYDGVVPVSGDLAGFLTLSQMRELMAYIRRFRSPSDPFDVVRFSPPHDARAAKLIAPLADAGVTWWIETIAMDETRRSGANSFNEFAADLHREVHFVSNLTQPRAKLAKGMRDGSKPRCLSAGVESRTAGALTLYKWTAPMLLSYSEAGGMF